MRVLAFFAAALLFASTPLRARADEPDPTPMLPDVASDRVVREPHRDDRRVMPAPPPRRRRDATLFGVGLGTAIAGGLTLSIGASVVWLGSIEDRAFGTGGTTIRTGGILMACGAAAALIAIPVAIYGGKKVPVADAAIGPGTLRVTF